MFSLFLLIFGLSISAYALHDILSNIDSYANIHYSLCSKSSTINESITNISIKDLISNLELINFIEIGILLILTILLIFKLQYNKNISNVLI
jgi:hypothetical protein